MNFTKLTLTSLLTASALFAGTYNVDVSHSNIGFKVKHLMISNVSGKFDKFNGTFEYDEKTKTVTSLNGNIEASSINTQNEKRDGHLKSADFFEITKYPNLTFKLDKISENSAFGKLTLHGVTKDVKLDFEDNGSIVDLWGNTRIGLSLSGEINRKDYGLTWNKALEVGGVVVGDKIKLDIELEGILAK